MLYIPESPLSGQIITLLKPVGKEIPLRLGEIIEGQVVDIFPYGGLTLKVKGGYLPARTNLNFEKQETLFLKVLGQSGEGGELAFQFLNSKTGPEGRQSQAKTSLGFDLEKIEDLTKKLSDLILKNNGPGIEEGKDPGSILVPRSLDVQKIRGLLEGLLKALPSNIQSLSRGLRNQIQQLLQFSLKGSGQDIQTKIAQLPTQLPEGLNIPDLVQGLKGAQLFFGERFNAEQLKTALENSGVVLESKLRAFVNSNDNDVLILNNAKIKNDIKSILLQLKAMLEQKGEPQNSPGLIGKILGGLEKTLGKEVGPFQKTQGRIETLLKDVETYQLLSKISDSFYSFLPVCWAELKRGELVFKRRQQSRGTSYSCAIHLDLEKLGPISVFIFMQDRDFFMTFQVDQLDLKAMIQTHLEELRKNFSREGLNLKNISLLGRSENLPDPFDFVESEETIISIRV